MNKITKTTIVQALSGNMEVFENLFASEITGLSLMQAFRLAKQLQSAANATSRAIQEIEVIEAR